MTQYPTPLSRRWSTTSSLPAVILPTLPKKWCASLRTYLQVRYVRIATHRRRGGVILWRLCDNRDGPRSPPVIAESQLVCA